MYTTTSSTGQSTLLHVYYPGTPATSPALEAAGVVDRPLADASELLRLLRDLSILAVVLCDLTVTWPRESARLLCCHGQAWLEQGLQLTNDGRQFLVYGGGC
jgi:hypothetical protein